MKKKNILMVITLLLLLTNLYQYKESNDLKESYDTCESELIENKYIADELLIEAQTELNLVNDNLDKLNEDISLYGDVIYMFFC